MRTSNFEAKKMTLDVIWEELVEKFKAYDYVEMASCNKDYSRYLVKRGTEDRVSYFGKPQLSLRISDHWNWINNRKAPGKIQCKVKDMWPPKEGQKPSRRVCIAIYDNGQYHYICGDKRVETKIGDRKWEWVFDTSCAKENVEKFLERIEDIYG